MRRLLLLLSLFLLANGFAFGPAHAQAPGYYAPGPPPPAPGYYAPGPPPPAPGYYPPAGPAPPPPYVGSPGPYARSQATNPENCGTPDQFKPCPPMPRVPLQYYPANRQ